MRGKQNMMKLFSILVLGFFLTGCGISYGGSLGSY